MKTVFINIRIQGLLLVAVILCMSKMNAQTNSIKSVSWAKDQINLNADGLFKFIRTIKVIPDTHFKTAAFVRIGYVPATNNLAVTFGGAFKDTINDLNGGYAYKEYNLDMQATGKFGALYACMGDNAGLMVDNNLYTADMAPNGWRLIKFDAVSWKKLAETIVPFDLDSAINGDMMLAFVNGQLDISSQCLINGEMAPPESGTSTHHHFFSPDLNYLGKRVLSDTPHITGSTMIFVEGMYYLITATAYTGDVIVMKYDINWKYMGMKELIKQGHWSEGVAFDGHLFYIAYLNTSQRTEPGFWPYYPNVHLAAFNRDWNLVVDVAVTDYLPIDSMFTGRPSLLMHGNRIYVSYDAVPLPEDLDKIEGYVSIYDLNPEYTSIKQNEETGQGFYLEQNYPNPFTDITKIRFCISEDSKVVLEVYDITGGKVAAIMDENLDTGYHEVEFKGDNLHEGIYFCRIHAGSFQAMKKMVLLRD